jgi:DNA-binding PucR family transcriptional regulator
MPEIARAITSRWIAEAFEDRVDGDERLLAELADRAVAPLGDHTEKARTRLLEALRAWLDHQGRVPHVAAALRVHPQTVRYRMAALRDPSGARCTTLPPASS